jgi:hypothetical protein
MTKLYLSLAQLSPSLSPIFFTEYIIFNDKIEHSHLHFFNILVRWLNTRMKLNVRGGGGPLVEQSKTTLKRTEAA